MRKNGPQERYDRWVRRRRWERFERKRPYRRVNWAFIIPTLLFIAIAVLLIVTA